MTAVFETRALLAATKRLAAVIDRRNTIPILANILIEAEGDSVRLTATDLDIQLSLTVHAAVAEPFAVTVDAMAIRDFAARVDSGSQISLDSWDPVDVKFTSGRKRMTLPCLPASDYPKMESREAGVLRPISFSTLTAMMKYCKPAISTEETRYYLNGVYWYITDGHLRAVATDGHRLSQIDGPEWPEQTGVIIPTKTVGILAALSDSDGEIGVTETMITVTGPDFELRSKVIDGSYPDHTRVIPVLSPNDLQIEVDIGALLSAASVIELTRGDKDPSCTRFEVTDDGNLDLSGFSIGKGSTGDMLTPKSITGDPFVFGLNTKYLTSILTEFEEGTIRLATASAATPIRFERPDQNDRISVIMPMRT